MRVAKEVILRRLVRPATVFGQTVSDVTAFWEYEDHALVVRARGCRLDDLVVELAGGWPGAVELKATTVSAPCNDEGGGTAKGDDKGKSPVPFLLETNRTFMLGNSPDGEPSGHNNQNYYVWHGSAGLILINVSENLKRRGR